ncbi:unnamed protein product [Arabidopsis lyrata]|nr:unnamed protein product [Arabidopsis lyrata]
MRRLFNVGYFITKILEVVVDQVTFTFQFNTYVKDGSFISLCVLEYEKLRRKKPIHIPGIKFIVTTPQCCYDKLLKTPLTSFSTLRLASFSTNLD